MLKQIEPANDETEHPKAPGVVQLSDLLQRMSVSPWVRSQGPGLLMSLIRMDMADMSFTFHVESTSDQATGQAFACKSGFAQRKSSASARTCTNLASPRMQGTLRN